MVEYASTGAAAGTGDAFVDAVSASFAHLRICALTRACAVAIDTDFASADAAEETLAILTGFLDAELEADLADDVFTALSDLRAAMAAALIDIAARLPRLRPLKVPAATPSLVLAYELYEDLGREDEILELNPNRHPGFLAGELTVLSQ